MGTWLAPATDPLGCQESFLTEQAQHPFAANLHAVLAAQPSPDLAVTLTGEG
jgi:hypothetical protein